MRLDALRREVLAANLEIERRGLAIYTFGNASGIDRENGLVAIKPSGIAFDALTPHSIVLVDMQGRIVEGGLRPSSDLPTHLELYRAFPQIGGVVHTHSRNATAWAQAGLEIPCLGTTHADYFDGCVPVTAAMSDEEIRGEYEKNTGAAIVRRFADLDPLCRPGVLVTGHGPFAWGRSPGEAARNAVLLEEIAAIAWQTLALNANAGPLAQALHERHFKRKHGPDAYYGQTSGH